MIYHKGFRNCLTDWLNCLIISEVCPLPLLNWLTNRMILLTNSAIFTPDETLVTVNA